MKNYNLYNILKIRSNVDFLPDFFKTKKSISPDLIVREGDFKFNKKGLKHQAFRFSLKFFSKPGQVFVEQNPGTQFFKLLLKDLEKSTKFYFNKSGFYRNSKNITEKLDKKLRFKPFSIPFRIYDPEKLIKHILHIKLLQKGYTFAHSTALMKDGKVVLLPAWQATGKSTTCYKLIKSGFEPLGDELNIVSKSGEVYQLFDTGAILEKNKRYRVPFNITPSKRHGRLDKVFLLKRGPEKTKKAKPSEIINKMISATSYELEKDFPRNVFLSYCFSANFPPDFIENNSRKILSKALKGKRCYEVSGDRTNFYKTLSNELALSNSFH